MHTSVSDSATLPLTEESFTLSGGTEGDELKNADYEAALEMAKLNKASDSSLHTCRRFKDTPILNDTGVHTHHVTTGRYSL